MDGEATPTSKLPAAGDVIGDGYSVVRKLGVGGMGAVFEVENPKRGGRSAMKIMLPNLAIDAEFRARFEREARISSMVTSAHVAEVKEVGSLDDGRLFMVMELLVGNDLEHELRARGPLPVDEVAGYVIQACDALHEAHKHQIVHRDLKPANLYLSRKPDGSRVVKVLDFGISKKIGSTLTNGDGPTLTTTDSMLGSPKYMSPEHLRNPKLVDARSDIWSLGVILYKLLSDRLPFDGESLGAYLSMVVAEDPAPLSTPEQPFPPGLVRVVSRCLAKDPKARIRTVAQLAVALQPFAPKSVAPIVERLRREDPSAADLGPEPTITDRADLAEHGLSERGGLSLSTNIAEANTASRRSRDLADPARTKGSNKLVWGAVAVLASALVVVVVLFVTSRDKKAAAGATTAAPDPSADAATRSTDATKAAPTANIVVGSATPNATTVADPAPPSTDAASATASIATKQAPPFAGPNDRQDPRPTHTALPAPNTATNAGTTTAAPPPTHGPRGPMEPTL